MEQRLLTLENLLQNAVVVQLLGYGGNELFELWFRLEYTDSFRSFAEMTTLVVNKHEWGYVEHSTSSMIIGWEGETHFLPASAQVSFIVVFTEVE